MPITDVIIDKGATTTDRGGMVFNVRAYGAVGDGVADDTSALKAAIAAATLPQPNAADTASSARGSVVFVPHGMYKLTDTIHLSSGVSIRGAGNHTTQLRFAMNADKDGLVWDQGIETAFHVGGFLEDIDVITTTGQAGGTARDLVVVRQWADFAINRVRILGASSRNLLLHNVVNISAFHLLSVGAGVSNLYIGADPVTVSTTCRFVGCYFQNSRNGPAADVAGLSLSFDGCVFEDSGATTAAAGYGIRVRAGTTTITGPYFEANRSWDVITGTDPVSTNNAGGPSVTLINPVFSPGTPKVTGTGSVRLERGSAVVLGGKFGLVPNPLVMTREMDMVFVAADFYPYVPTVEGGTFADIPGTVLYKKPATGQTVQAGNVVYGINP